MVRQLSPLRVERLAQVKYEMADRVGGVPAVAEQLFVGRVAMNELVLLECDQQIEKRLRRNMKTLDRLVESDHDRMPRLAFVAAQQLVTPPVQQVESPLAAACFVREVVGPAAI